MNKLEFMTYNNEFKIVLEKKKKLYSSHKYTQYECSITFLNSINYPVLLIKCSEKEFFSAICSLNELDTGNVLSDNIYFTSDSTNPCFIFVSNLNELSISESYPDYPQLEEDMIQFSIYETNIQGNVLRIYLEMTYYYLEEFIYNMYRIIEDIPYLNELSYSDILDFMEYNNLKKENL